MSQERVIRWGIIGCGNVTEVKSGPGFQKAAGSALVAVMRRDAALARDYAARHGVPKWYDNAHALVNEPDVDAVYVATPPSSHREYALLAARAGKTVYVEKPMALNHAECLEMIAACRAAGTPLFVAYYRRAQQRFLTRQSRNQTGACWRFAAPERTLLTRRPLGSDGEMATQLLTEKYAESLDSIISPENWTTY